jgi:hypothetical protein
MMRGERMGIGQELYDLVNRGDVDRAAARASDFNPEVDRREERVVRRDYRDTIVVKEDAPVPLRMDFRRTLPDHLY